MKTYKVEYLDFNELDRVASEIINIASAVKTVTLQGDLGSGKTTLIKAFCRQLGVSIPVSSPTFTLINQYNLNNSGQVFHIDMYRMENERDAYQLGLDELFQQNAWFFIEWPEKIESWLPENFVSLKIEVDTGTNARIITIREA